MLKTAETHLWNPYFSKFQYKNNKKNKMDVNVTDVTTLINIILGIV